MNKQECVSAQWQTVGYGDGSAGRPAAVIDNYRTDCAEHRVAPDLESCLRGRAQGLVEFSKPANGFHLGERGERYQGVCPRNPAAEFLAAITLIWSFTI